MLVFPLMTIRFFVGCLFITIILSKIITCSELFEIFYYLPSVNRMIREMDNFSVATAAPTTSPISTRYRWCASERESILIDY